MNLEKNIKECLLKNKICKLENMLLQANIKNFKNLLIEIAFETENITIYSIVCMLLIKKETVELHQLAIDLLVHPLCIINGAASAALYHARKAIELSPNNPMLKESLLFFHNVPEKLVSTEEAISTAREILNMQPNNQCAKLFLEKYKKDKPSLR